MQVVGYDPRRHSEDVPQAGERLLEKLHSLVVFQVADVLAQDCVAALGEAESVFEFAAERQYLVQLDSEVDGLRDEPARASQHTFAALEGTNHGIVNAGPDVTVMK